MEILIISIFVLGYAAIAFEHSIKINKAASALLTGVLCWTAYILFIYVQLFGDRAIINRPNIK